MGCSPKSDKRLKEARATVTTTFGETARVLPLCPDCRRKFSDEQVAAIFAQQFGAPPETVRLHARRSAPPARTPPAPTPPETLHVEQPPAEAKPSPTLATVPAPNLGQAITQGIEKRVEQNEQQIQSLEDKAKLKPGEVTALELARMVKWISASGAPHNVAVILAAENHQYREKGWMDERQEQGPNGRPVNVCVFSPEGIRHFMQQIDPKYPVGSSFTIEPNTHAMGRGLKNRRDVRKVAVLPSLPSYVSTSTAKAPAPAAATVAPKKPNPK